MPAEFPRPLPFKRHAAERLFSVAGDTCRLGDGRRRRGYRSTTLAMLEAGRPAPREGQTGPAGDHRMEFSQMSNLDATTGAPSYDEHRPDGYADHRSRRITTETKSSHKTTELIAYVVAVLGVLIASAVVDASDFGAQEAWFYVTLLTIGYMVSRGLAKSGSREPYDDGDTR